MRYWKNSRMMAAHLVAVLLLLSWSLVVKADGIVFKVVSLGEEQGQILLDVVEEFELTDTMLEALKNGVPLTFSTHIVLESEQQPLWGLLWPEQKVNRFIRRQLRFHPLSEEYEVIDLSSGYRRRFATREAALAALGELKGVRLIAIHELDAQTYYQLRIQAEHEIGALPLPLRPKAYLTPSWHLSSKVYEWRLKP